MMAAAPPAYPSVAAAGVAAGDFIGVQYRVGGVPLIHERLVVVLPPGQPGVASVVTPDDDEYDELYVGSADVARWDVFPGGAAGGVMPWAPGARYYRFRSLPTPATLRTAAGAAAARLGLPPPVGPIVPNAAGRVLAVAAAAPGAIAFPAVGPAAAPAAGVAGLVAALGGPALAPGAPVPLPPAAAAAPPAAAAAAPAAAAPPGPVAGAGDARVHPVVYNPLGSRRVGFGDAVVRLVEQQWPDWPISGPRTTLWVCQFIKDNGLSPLGRHSKWRSEGRLSQTDAGVAEHERCCFYLEQMVCFDQLNVPDIAAAEMICRSIQVQEERWRERFVTNADESLDSHLFYGTSANRGNVCVHPQLLAFVSGELSKEYAVAKERRKAREERQSA